MTVLTTERARIGFLLDTDPLFGLPLSALSESVTGVIGVPDKTIRQYRTNYIGSKQKLVDWIWQNTPDGVQSVVDVFAGSCAVGYMYKSKGLRVLANDKLAYAYHIARAIIENSHSRLSDDDIDLLVASNDKAGEFVKSNFEGMFFKDGVHAIIDQVRANCDLFTGYKRDIALFALGKACVMDRWGNWGHFHVATVNEHAATPEDFIARVKSCAAQINALVFDNGHECQAYNADAAELLPTVTADLAYFDPPYATEFTITNYATSYHFVEGLMINWDGVEIKADSKVHTFANDHQTITKTNGAAFFESFLGSASTIPNWLISYRDKAYPNESEMQRIIASCGRGSTIESHDHRYGRATTEGAKSKATELLFLASAPNPTHMSKETPMLPMQSIVADVPALPGTRHASIPITLHSDAMDGVCDPSCGEPSFRFILCHVGTNRNGDNFTAQELSTRYTTAINKKIDLKHNQDITDIVGGVVSAVYLDDAAGQRIECVGELYTLASQDAVLAYTLLKKGIVTQVSMECDYQEGECSICGKIAKTQKDYCQHLSKQKGGTFQGKPVFEILHGVTFTGLGLLDRPGADENARILQVASLNEEETGSVSGIEQQGTTNDIEQAQGDAEMLPKKDAVAEAAKKTDEEAADNAAQSATKHEDTSEDAAPDSNQDEAAKKDATPASDAATAKADDKDDLIAAQKDEIAELQKQIEALKAQVDESAEASRKAARMAQAEKLVSTAEKGGAMAFANDEARNAEVARLSALSEDGLAATETAIALVLGCQTQRSDGAIAESDTAKPEAKPEAKASAKADVSAQSATADKRALDIDDAASLSGVNHIETGIANLLMKSRRTSGGSEE